MEPPEIRAIVSQPFAENSYVIWRAGNPEAVVVDPGLEPQLILDCLHAAGLACAAILNTHGHADHIGGNEALKQAFPQAPLVVGAGEAHLLTDARENLSAAFGIPIVSPPADRLVRENEVLDYAGLQFQVLEVPGHSPGHVVFLHRSTPMVVFGGDVLFQGSIGRSDFPHSDAALLFRGIRNKLFALPDETLVYPGHGDLTTVGRERLWNPFVGENTTSTP